MNFNNEIVHYAIPHGCNQCKHNKNCRSMYFNKPDPLCYNFEPVDINNFLNNIILYFRLNYPKSKDKKLKRKHTQSGSHVYNDKIDTLDYYYVNFINDCIGQLRKGKTVYVFKLSHILEIVQFYSDINANYLGDGIIALHEIK